MSKVYVVGHGLNVQGIFDDAQEAAKAVNRLPAIEINNTLVQPTVMEDNADKYVMDYKQGIAVKCKGGDSYHLNSTLEDNKW